VKPCNNNFAVNHRKERLQGSILLWKWLWSSLPRTCKISSSFEFFLLVAEHLDIAGLCVSVFLFFDSYDRRYPGHGSPCLRNAHFDFDLKADVRCKIKDMQQVQEKQRASPDCWERNITVRDMASWMKSSSTADRTSPNFASRRCCRWWAALLLGSK
jgi:hypothetical protein